MKYTFLIVLLFSISLYAQEKTYEDAVKESDHDKPLTVIEHVPVYSGCDEKLPNAELKNCMTNKIRKHIGNTFNTKVSNNLGLPDGIVKINVFFKIDKVGKVTEISAKGPHPKLEDEAIRVMSLIPDMDKPGIQRGKPVIVPYSIPIAFRIKNKTNKLSKQERRRLKRQN